MTHELVLFHVGIIGTSKKKEALRTFGDFFNLLCFVRSIFLLPLYVDVDGLVQERHNSSVIAMEIRLSCTNPSI